MTTWVNALTGNPVKPAVSQFEALTISENTALVWPLETIEGVPYVASVVAVTASVADLQLQMPPANEGSTGIVGVFQNVGAQAFTLTDTSGNAIQTINPTQTYVVILEDNSTLDGTWSTILLGATVATATAAALADNETLQAAGAALQVTIPTTYYTASALLSGPQRGSLNVWQGTANPPNPNGVFSLDVLANLGTKWFCFVSNESSGTLTLQPTAGFTINGAGNVVLQPTVSAIVVCDENGNFNAVGVLATPISVGAGGTGANNPTTALINFGGTTPGITIFQSPTVASVLSYLGLNQISLVESSISTNQTLTAASSQTCFVATAALTLTLPTSTGLSTKFVFAVYAQGGAVTVTPQNTDAINGGTLGASYTLPQGSSALFTTDANGNWWPFFASASGTVTSVGLAASTEFVVTGSPVTGNGTITISKANQAANLVWAGPPSGAPAAPGFRALVSADLPAAVVVPDLLAGMTLSNDGTSPNLVLDVSAGSCADSTNSVLIQLAAFKKSIGGAWTAGSGNNGMGNGLVATANTWYNVHAIINGGAADVYFDTSPTAANAPAGTTAYRRLGSIELDANVHILGFNQNGDEFIWATVPGDVVNGNFPGPSGIDVTLSVPPGVKVNALFTADASSTSGESWVNFIPDPGVITSWNGVSLISDSGFVASGGFNIRTNTLAQIGVNSNSGGSGIYNIWTYGWIDTRGRFN